MATLANTAKEETGDPVQPDPVQPDPVQPDWTEIEAQENDPDEVAPVSQPIHVDTPSAPYVVPSDPVPDPDQKTIGTVSGVSTHASYDRMGIDATHTWVAPVLDAHLQNFYASTEAGYTHQAPVHLTAAKAASMHSFYHAMEAGYAPPAPAASTKVI